ncbi:hypothetical protein OG21DRAFT_1136235 [Imleria badia]|nr:hypothetical protein OG21DRAFT_1136235 [Imleria badia]
MALGLRSARCGNQPRFTSAPSAILSTVACLTGSAISGLHIIGQVLRSYLGDHSPLDDVMAVAIDCERIEWEHSYDLPSPNYICTRAAVNATNITSKCGLLPNTSVGVWNSSWNTYSVNISGLGEVALLTLALASFVSFQTSDNRSSATSLLLEWSSLPITQKNFQWLFIFCCMYSINLYLPMQNGRTTQHLSRPLIFNLTQYIWPLSLARVDPNSMYFLKSVFDIN